MKPISCSLIAGAALAGLVTCASAQPVHVPPAGPPTICNPGICRIAVTVNDCGASGGIIVDPPYVAMPGTSGPAVIHWKIVTPGFVFAAGGIRFDPAQSQFHQLPAGPADEIRMRNDRTSRGDFYYFVEVRDCIPVDPWIRN